MRDEYTQWLEDVDFGRIDLTLDDFVKWREYDSEIIYRLPNSLLGDLINQGLEYKWMYDGLE